MSGASASGPFVAAPAQVPGVGRVFRGHADAKGLRIALAASRFHEHWTLRLVRGAADELARLGARAEDVDLAWVPGAFELPFLAQTLARTGRYDAIVALGVVVRGETPHFEYVCAEAARGLSVVARSEGVPVMFGVVTADTEEQVAVRAALAGDAAGEGGGSNKGADAARAAIEFVFALREAR
jgi:6,7-dimethyl-8-ribityllumazine synthase